jgi:DNA-binding response OmpR family regulator
MTGNAPIRVLIVDDNTQYREAFKRNLTIGGFEVYDAENADRAMEIMREGKADVLVTDLQMRTQTEGLDLIRDTRSAYPCLPIIMISAVGTFDEGAMASRMGAAHVLSKAKIDEEIGLLHDCIRESYGYYCRALETLEEIGRYRQIDEEDRETSQKAVERLGAIIADTTNNTYVRNEASDILTNLSMAQLQQRSRADLDRALGGGGEKISEEALAWVDVSLRKIIPSFDNLHEESRDNLRTAEYLYQNIEQLGAGFDFDRTICFSYSFSVENQTKSILRKRLTKFVADKENLQLVESLLEKPGRQVNLFLHQHILQVMRGRAMDFTIDNVRQTFLRILEHGSKYRPDGLKALGIILLTFGRTYSFKQFNKTVEIANPLGLKGLETDEDIICLAELLVNLQHYRNPYIHPEISNKQDLSKIRETSIECLKYVMRLE